MDIKNLLLKKEKIEADIYNVINEKIVKAIYFKMQIENEILITEFGLHPYNENFIVINLSVLPLNETQTLLNVPIILPIHNLENINEKGILKTLEDYENFISKYGGETFNNALKHVKYNIYEVFDFSFSKLKEYEIDILDKEYDFEYDILDECQEKQVEFFENNYKINKSKIKKN